ncbi:MAG: molybdopterin biosynthesis enzyme [Deltaproteobacteria bacterium]|nr:molybdopterin biosynthesis enzyme [Deltaproteobacteria bacterium]
MSKYKSSATIISLEEAVGKVLAHDITEIRPGQFKGAAFKKGHVVQEQDLPHLRRLGKEHLFVLHIEPGEVHEDDAALKLAEALSGTGVTFKGPPSEGKLALRAEYRGLLKVNVEALYDLCLIPEISCASRHNNDLVEKEEIIAAARAVPLIIEEAILEKALAVARRARGIFSVKKFSKPPTGILITGNEVFHGLIEDKFAPILNNKLKAFDCEVRKILFAPDDKRKIANGIRELLDAGSKLVMVAGGMSVDPDDISRVAIAEAGVQDILYGTPVLPGAMFLYGRIGSIPVLGLPACILFYKATVLDLLLPRILAGEVITREDLAAMAHGGLCLGCAACRYPVCPFGK